MNAEQKPPAKAAGKKKEHVLEGELTLQNAAAIKELFAKAISGRRKKLAFTFRDVADVDLSFVQILCAAHRAAHEKGKTIEFTGCWPEPFTGLIQEAGLNEHVGCVTDCSLECPWLDK